MAAHLVKLQLASQSHRRTMERRQDVRERDFFIDLT